MDTNLRQRAMNAPEHFELRETHAVFRPSARVSEQQAIALVTSAIAYARAQKIKKLLLDTTALTGFKPPDIATRYYYIHEWATAARGQVYIAILARPEMIDPRKFVVTVAANIGLI